MLKGEGGRNFWKTVSGKQSFGERNLIAHKAICSECGEKCEVPFKPTDDKPVLLQQLFLNQGRCKQIQ